MVYLLLAQQPDWRGHVARLAGALGGLGQAARAIILFDAAYEAFVRDPGLPHSIFEIPGAREVALEFRSFSKTAGFTGTRCAFTVIPKELKARDETGAWVALHGLWNRRHTTKFNGVSYPIQRAAAAVFTPEGAAGTQANIDYTMENARLIREGLGKAGYRVFGGVNAPYIWMQVPAGMTSWQYFDRLLHEAPRGGYTGLRLRKLRRGLLPPVRLRLPRKRGGGGGAHLQQVAGLTLARQEPHLEAPNQLTRNIHA